MSTATEVEPGQVWAARYQTGVYVAVAAVHEDRARVKLLPVTVTPQGSVAVVVGRQRWTSKAQLQRAYRPTTHVLESARP